MTTVVNSGQPGSPIRLRHRVLATADPQAESEKTRLESRQLASCRLGFKTPTAADSKDDSFITLIYIRFFSYTKRIVLNIQI